VKTNAPHPAGERSAHPPDAGGYPLQKNGETRQTAQGIEARGKLLGEQGQGGGYTYNGIAVRKKGGLHPDWHANKNEKRRK